MKFNSFLYFISDAFKSLKRNKTISFASMATVLATLFVFGAFLLTALNVKAGISNVQSKVEIKVFLKDDVTKEQQEQIKKAMSSVQGVKEVIYESRDEALKNFREQMKENESILEGYDEANNPMPASFIAKLDTPDVATSVEKAITLSDGKLMIGVESIGNDQELIDTINSFANTIKWIGVALFIVLIAVSLFLIVNTIKITVYSRRREIGIMKFVGATDWFIRWPFIIEGIVIGVVGAIIADLLLFGFYDLLIYRKMTQGIVMTQFVTPTYIVTVMLAWFVAAGALIGTFGSIIALRKFLDV
ncbi:permease-like cell division protein FtsX [Clostridium tarantellae]|uniref:Cell division protein FtsX n=1 Tax=Clostridium tarantellae TaxID=39493 RepID=A0A6I1MIF5_9CLOT|nr:permease-like cell division protein FtsX [Clostridium tarantellae]MPQ43145.1 FtsX-like permease family protein [Clostridium tarantellae]